VKKTILVVFILSGCFTFGQQPGCIHFGDDKKISYTTEWGFFKTNDDFASNKEESAEKVKSKSDWRGEFNYDMVINGQKTKIKSSELAKKYWGYHYNWQVFRFDTLTTYNINKTWELQCIGELCLYASHPFEITGFTKDENNQYHYSYKYDAFADVGISIGINGKIYPLNNNNFVLVLGTINSGYKVDYLKALSKIESAKMDQSVTAVHDNMKLFIEYFEMINNEANE
jgi:hypothetical protein